MAKTVKMEVFRAGKQTDSSGRSREWTEKDLDKIVEKFSERGEAPATIGHPDTDTAPAHGWFKKVWRDGNTLWAELSEYTKEFGEMLKNKMFKNRSIALSKDLELLHVAFLGAMPPAVKGLKDFAFKKEDCETFEFRMDNDAMYWEVNHAFEVIGRLFQKVRDQIVAKDGSETAEKLMPQYEIDAIQRAKIKSDSNYSSFNQDPNGGQTMDIKELEAKNEALETKNAELTSQVGDLKAKFEAEQTKNAAFSARIEAMEVKQKDGEFNAFLDGLISEGKLLPASKPAMFRAMKAMDDKELIEFSAGEAKKTELAKFKEDLESAPKIMEFGERFTNGNAAPAPVKEDALDNEVKKYMAEKGVSFQVAYDAIVATKPELLK